MRYFPLFADLDAAGVLVAGGGEQAAQKVRLLRKTNARTTVVAEVVTDELRDLERQGAIMIVPRAFVAGDLDGQRLVYAATGDRALDAAVSQAAQARGIPVNVVDVPELSTFITPAIVDRAPVTVAIGTEGAAPVLAREIKTRLESWLPANLGSARRKSPSAALRCRHQRSRWPRAPPPLGAAAAGTIPPRRPQRRRSRSDSHLRRRDCGLAGNGHRPRRPDRLRPRRSRSPDAQGSTAHAGGRCAGRRPAGEPQDPGLRPARCRAHLRRQDPAAKNRPHKPRSTASSCARPPPARWWPASKAAIR